MNRWMSCAVLVVTVMAPGAPAGAVRQARPNFSGGWICTSPGNLAGIEMTVTQDERTLRADTGVASLAMTYTLDGTDTRRVFPMVIGDIVVEARARWRGDELEIVETTAAPEEPKTHRTQLWSMKGAQLAVLYNVRTEGQSRTQVVDSLWRRK